MTARSYTLCASFMGSMYKKFPSRNSFKVFRSKFNDSVKVGIRFCFWANGLVALIVPFVILPLLLSLGYSSESNWLVSGLVGVGNGGATGELALPSLDSCEVAPSALSVLTKLFNFGALVNIFFDLSTNFPREKLPVE